MRSSSSEEERREDLRQLLGCGGVGNAKNELLQRKRVDIKIELPFLCLAIHAGHTNSSSKFTEKTLQASKAAVLNFFETLRMELHDEVGVTIATPGWIESEMTKGKHLSKDGTMKVDQDLRDVSTPHVHTPDVPKPIDL